MIHFLITDFCLMLSDSTTTCIYFYKKNSDYPTECTIRRTNNYATEYYILYNILYNRYIYNII